MRSDDVAALMVGFVGILMWVVMLAIFILLIVAYWKLFEKAGIEGWKCLIPFYSSYCFYKIAMGNGWIFLVVFVPCVGTVVSIIQLIKLAQAFGKGIGFGILTVFFTPIMLMILAFTDAEYIGPQ